MDGYTNLSYVFATAKGDRKKFFMTFGFEFIGDGKKFFIQDILFKL